MRRSHRIGATATATAGLLIGAGVSIAALQNPASAEEQPKSTRTSATTDPAGTDAGVAALSDSADRLKAEAAALQEELRTRQREQEQAEQRAKDQADARQQARAEAESDDHATARTTAPSTHTTTGASGSAGATGGGDDEDDEHGESSEEGEDD
jgi:TolA-binding protein